MRVGILALLHESNTFISRPTTIENFRELNLLSGEAVRDRLAGTHHEIGGFFGGLSEFSDVEVVPIFAARALPSGTIRADAWATLMQMMFEALDGCGAINGILVAPHGATVSESHPDADGHWLSELRSRVGNDTPIIGTIDPHANLSPLMVHSCDALTAYRTNPHLDQRQRGEEAARLIVRTLRGEIRPTMHAEFPPIAVNIERQLTTEPQWKPLYELADQQLENPKVLTNSLVLGFPYADVSEMGSSVIAVTNADAELAKKCARELARELWDRREDFAGQLIEINEAIVKCQRLEGPICLLDMGDNVGGGSAADGTYLLHALHERKIPKAFVCLYDPESVREATKTGIGNKAKFSLGGKTDDQHGQPLRGEFRVCSFHDGQFEEPEVRHGGFHQFDQGATAIVESDHGLTVMLTSKRMVPFSLWQLRSCGLNPADFQVLVAKGVNAPVAAYQEICRYFLRVNTPGSTCADMTHLNFTRRRRPLFPFEHESAWNAEA